MCFFSLSSLSCDPIFIFPSAAFYSLFVKFFWLCNFTTFCCFFLKPLCLFSSFFDIYMTFSLPVSFFFPVFFTGFFNINLFFPSNSPSALLRSSILLFLLFLLFYHLLLITFVLLSPSRTLPLLLFFQIIPVLLCLRSCPFHLLFIGLRIMVVVVGGGFPGGKLIAI